MDAEREQASLLLRTYGIEEWPRVQSRVRLAVIKLFGGKLAKLAWNVEEAKSDYRDVLSAAEFPEESQSLKPRHEAVERDRKPYLDWLHAK